MIIYAAGGLGLLMLCWWIWNLNTLPVTVHEFRIETSPVNPGGRMRVVHTYEKRFQCPGVVRQKITGCGDRNWLVSELPTMAPLAYGNQKMDIYVKAPPDLPLGKSCNYTIEARFYCNPLHFIFPLVLSSHAPFTIAQPEQSIQEMMREMIDDVRESN